LQRYHQRLNFLIILMIENKIIFRSVSIIAKFLDKAKLLSAYEQNLLTYILYILLALHIAR